jgi:hypothetical protein
MKDLLATIELYDDDDTRVGLKRGSQPPPDTSPVKTDEYKYPRSNRFGTVYSKTPGKNQYKAMRTLEEVQKAIDDAPSIKIGDKLFEQNRKDLRGDSEYSGKQVVTRKEQDKYGDKLKYKSAGKKRIEDTAKYTEARKAKDLYRSNPAILNKLAGKEGLQLAHLSLGELDTLKNLGYLPADINIKQYHPFEKKIVAISKDIYDIQNDKNLSVSEKRMAIAQKQKDDRALRKKFPQYAKTKARLNVKATGFGEGLMIKEKLPDKSIAIAPDEAGTTLKQIDSKSAKASEILKLGKDSLQKNLLQRYAVIGCGGKAAKEGGRINFDAGASISCIRRGLEKVRSGNNLSPGDQANIRAINNITKTAKGAKAVASAARILGAGVIAPEIVFGGFFAATDYATGADKDEIISNLTFGLGGKSMKEQLKESDPRYGQADKLTDVYQGYLSSLNKLGEPKQYVGRPGKRTSEQDVLKAMEPFTRVNPQTETGDFFDLGMYESQLQKDRGSEAKFAEDKMQRALERGFYDPGVGGSRRISEFQAAGGGIAKEAGDPSGRPPESGPQPQGLLSLKNRVRNY